MDATLQGLGPSGGSDGADSTAGEASHSSPTVRTEPDFIKSAERDVPPPMTAITMAEPLTQAAMSMGGPFPAETLAALGMTPQQVQALNTEFLNIIKEYPSLAEMPEDGRLAKLLGELSLLFGENIRMAVKMMKDLGLQITAQELEKINETINALAKQASQKSVGLLKKIFSILAVIVSFIMVIVMPTPMTVAALMVTLTLVLEPMLAELGGWESVVEKVMMDLATMFEGLDIPLAAKAILGALLVMVVLVAATFLLAAGISMLTNSAGLFTMIGSSTTQAGAAAATAARLESAAMTYVKAADAVVVAGNVSLQIADGVITIQVGEITLRIDKMGIHIEADEVSQNRLNRFFDENNNLKNAIYRILMTAGLVY